MGERLCGFESCGRVYYSSGWCHGHYAQSRRDKGMYPLFLWRTDGGKGFCAVDDCGRVRVRKGLCEAHYQQKRAGKEFTPVRPPAVQSPKGATLEQKLAAAKLRATSNARGCWGWVGSHDKRGYGRIRDESGKSWMIHRAAYHAWVGEIPPGSVVHHRCSNPSCFNPEHLQLTTHHDNAAEMWARRGLEAEIRRLTAEVARLEQENARLRAAQDEDSLAA